MRLGTDFQEGDINYGQFIQIMPATGLWAVYWDEKSNGEITLSTCTVDCLALTKGGDVLSLVVDNDGMAEEIDEADNCVGVARTPTPRLEDWTTEIEYKKQRLLREAAELAERQAKRRKEREEKERNNRKFKFDVNSTI